jgi:hypothetical protein
METAIIPAQPGYYILTLIDEGDKEPYEFCRTPVIAWRVSAEMDKTGRCHVDREPIGDADTGVSAILRPDGSVYIDYADSFYSEAEAMGSFVDEYRRRTENT